MKFRLQKGVNEHQVAWGTWQVVVCGDPVDDRGASVLDVLATKTPSMKVVKYLPESLKINVESRTASVDDVADALGPILQDRVLLEATTLGLVEIVLCCKTLYALGHKTFDIAYLEPDDYNRPRRSRLLHKRDFELSGEVPGYRAIPGSALFLADRKPIRTVFFVGYEEARLRRAFEELQMLNAGRSSIALGVPAFKAGWEMDAMANNISVVRENNIRGGIHFCAAENPHAVVELLDEVYQGLENGERLLLVPIGTKPHGIGVALFAATHNDVGLIYDHPRRTKGRSNNLGHWHLFTIDDFQAVQ